MPRAALLRRLIPTRRFTDSRSGTPLTAMLMVGLVLFGLASLVLAMVGISAGSLFALSIDGVAEWELWRIATFALSSFGPNDAASTSFLPSLLVSVMVMCLSAAVLWLAGPTAERRLGFGPAVALVSAAMIGHGLLSLLVLRLDHVFAPTAVVMALLTVAQLTRFEREGEKSALREDGELPLILGGFLLLAVAVAAAFDAQSISAFVGALVGPMLGLAAFSMVRSHEVSKLEEQGSGTVAGVLYADDAELLTIEELTERTDGLLDQISRRGYSSLDRHQRQFLVRASARLRSAGAAAPSEKR